MCGIAGFIDTRGALPGVEMPGIARRMADRLAHRGPDDAGEWCDEKLGVALAHRRLSIIDRSAEGHQPMVSASGRFVITYNGEVYNFKQLAQEAARDGVRFHGGSDTEVLLATVERLGVRKALENLAGMFAFALWDRQERILCLARDRIGEKPLYFGWLRGTLAFASEIKALRCHPDWHGEVSRKALGLLLRSGYVGAPLSIFTNVYKLPPGTFLEIDLRRAAAPGEFSPQPDDRDRAFHPVPYWSLHDVIEGAEPFAGMDEEAAANELERRLSSVIRRQMISDVPLGALLSGGIDSSLVAALMQSQTGSPVKTFTIGFDEADYNEASYARAVADYLGTDHTEMYVTPAEARDVIPRLPQVYDEPFADSSQIPTCLVSTLARSRVTVALSGDAGDELFGGYERYRIADRLWRRLKAVPAPVRQALASGLAHCPQRVGGLLMGLAGRTVSARVRMTGSADQLQRLRELLATREFQRLYGSLISHWKAPQRVVKGAGPADPAADFERLPGRAATTYDRMMYLDTLRYLPGDILTKVDRASMAVSLEVRVPLLDHELVQWAWTLPLGLKVRNGKGKYLLRKVLNRHVPSQLTDRPKMGFGVPIDEWLRGPLREWAEDLLSEDRLQREGYFEPAPVRALWTEHLNGKGNWHYYIWDVLMFQSWNAANT